MTRPAEIPPAGPGLVAPLPHRKVGADGAASVVKQLQQSKLFREYQLAFESTTGLPLVLRAAGSFRPPLQGSKMANPFCTLLTRSSLSCAACLRLQQRVEREAENGPKTSRCHAGLSETAVPVRIGEQVLGYLQTGQVFFAAPKRESYRATVAAGLVGLGGAEAAALETAYLRTRVITRRQYGSIVRLLVIFAEHLATVSNRLLLRESAEEPPAVAKARAYIAEHHRDPLHLDEVARAANMSSFYFCKLFRKTTGFTFTAYLARARIESVKHRLESAQMRMSEAAFAAGFQSLSQFNRVFRRLVGEAPHRYRNRLHGHPGPARGPIFPVTAVDARAGACGHVPRSRADG